MNDGASIIVSLKFISPEDFSAIVRCKIPDTNRDPPITDYTNFIDSFIRKFSTITKSNWIVRKTFPNLKRLIYRKVYTCQHSSFNKKNSDKLQRKSKRNLNCTANIDITIRKINKNTCRNSVFLRQGYNIIINIYHKHSHLVQIADSFSLLKCEPKLNADFVEYFENGMTPATARLFHETNLMENNSIHDISEVLSNAQVNPTARHVQYIYDKWRKNKNVDRTCRNFEVIETDCMKEISSAYN